MTDSVRSNLNLQLYLKRDPGAGIFLLILQNFQAQFLYIALPVAAGKSFS